MKILNLFLTLVLSPVILCIEPEDDYSYTNHIVFSKENIKTSNNIKIKGTTVKIENPGSYYISGNTDEGNIEVKSDKVTLYLHNLKLTSEFTAPITVAKNLQDVKIINIENTVLEDLEDESSTEGECAVIKVKQSSIVHFRNLQNFRLKGTCKNIIKGGFNATLFFDKCEGEYIINANKTAISSDNSLIFNGGSFTIESEFGGAIKSVPDDSDNTSLGKILVNNGFFKIKSFKDAFVAENNLTIYNGHFEIKTQNGYNDEMLDVNVSSKGFKLNSDKEGAEMKIYNGDFKINTADDAFRSNKDLTILKGKYIIYTGDDAICAKRDLVLGEKDGPLDDLNIKVVSSYESLEGMTIKIYSGRIRTKATNDGINASGPIRHVEPDFNFSAWNMTRRNRTHSNHSNHNNNDWWNQYNNTDWWNQFNNSDWWNGYNRNRSSSNNSTRRTYHFHGNDSYYISIFGGEIYVDSDTDGMDSNGNIYIHGGNVNIFSSDKGTDNPIDRDGNLTVFNADVLAIGVRGAGYVHSWIDKGNQLYCFSTDKVNAYHMLEIVNENDEVVREEMIAKNISYIFYSSLKLNKNYTFYISKDTGDRIPLKVTCDYLYEGEDDEDVIYNKENKKNNENKKEETENENENENASKFLELYYIYLIMSILLL